MRRRTFPNFITDVAQLDERQERLERLMQMIGFSPDYPYTMVVNDGTRNRVEIGLVSGSVYGIRIINNAGQEILFADGHITADGITTGTLDASIVNVTNLDADNIVTGTISASKIAGGVLNCTLITMSSVNAAWITTGVFSNPNSRFANGTISGVKITDDTIEAPKIKANTITANKLVAHTLTGNEMTLGSAIITAAAQIGTAVITYAKIASVDAGTITLGTLNADRINVNTLHANKIISGTLTDTQIANLGISYTKIASMTADRINRGTLTGRTVATSTSTAKIIMSNGNTIEFYFGGVRRSRLYTTSAYGVYCENTFMPDSLYSGATPSSTPAFGSAYFSNNVSCLHLHLGQGGATEGSLYNVDIVEGWNDIRFLLDSTSGIYRFYGGEWNQKLWIDWWGNLMSHAGIYIDGDMSCGGSKPFKIEHPEDNDRYLTYTAIESPEVALLIRGRAKLAQGTAVITLPHHWELATEPGLNTYQVTPLDDCQCFVRELDHMSFEIVECGGGNSDIEVCWSVSAIRKGYADFDPEPLKTDDAKKKVAQAIEVEDRLEAKEKSTNEKVKNLTKESDDIHSIMVEEYHKLKKEKDSNYKVIVKEKHRIKADIWDNELSHRRKD